MVKYLVAWFLIIATAYAEAPVPRVGTRMSDESAVRLWTQHPEGLSRCSGFAISKTLIVTAAHCVSHGAQTSYEWEGARYQLKLLVMGQPATPYDIALLESEEPHPFRPLILNQKKPKLDEEVFFLVNNSEGPFKYAGKMSADFLPEDWAIKAACMRGDSGGAVLNKDGEVFAVEWGVNNNTAECYVSPIRTLVSWLKRFRIVVEPL